MYSWLLLLIAYLPFQVALNLWPGFDLASGRVFILLLFFIWLTKATWEAELPISKCGKPSPPHLVNLRTICLLFFLFISGLSILAAENYWWGLRKFLFFLSVFPLYFLVSGLIDNWQKFKKAVWVLAAGAGLMALIGLIQFLAQFVFGLEKVYGFWALSIVPVFSGFNFGALILAYPSWLVNISGQTIMRGFSLFSDPHIFSLYLGLILPLAITLYLISVNYKKLLFAVCCLPFAGLALSFVRGAYLALIAAFLVLAWLLWKELNSKKIAILLLLSLLIFFIPGTPISARFYSTFNLTEGSNVGRLEMWQSAGQLSREHLWLGLGLGNYSLSIDPDFEYRNPATAHNFYLDLFSEIGIFALIIWLILIFGTIWQLYPAPFEDKENFARSAILELHKHSHLNVALISSLVYFSVHSIFETAIYSPVILAILMIILGLCSKRLSILESA